MTEKTVETLKKIDGSFEKIQSSLVFSLGDEANDIGDACDAEELLGNQSEKHDSYSEQMFVSLLSGYSGIAQADLLLALKEINN